MDRFAAHVLERLPDAVSIVGPDGVHVHTNRAANAILDDLGARHEGQPIGNVAWNAIDAGGRPLPNPHLPVEITRLTGRECSRVEVGFPDLSGAIRWLQISTRRLHDVPPPCSVIMSFADVTEQRRTREELRLYRERTEAVAEALHEGLIIQDREGRIVLANGRAQEILGGALEGRTAHDSASHPVDPDGQRISPSDLPSQQVLATGEARLGDLVGLTTPSGERRWLRINATPLHDERGAVDGVVETFRDVSRQRTEREELRRATELFSTAFAEAPNGMALVGLDGSFMKVNAEACEILGYSEAELLALTFQELTHPEDLDADLALLQETLDGTRRGYQMHKRYLRSDGRLIWAKLSVSLVAGEAGEPLHFISHIEDDTERRQLELRLQQLAERDDLTGLVNRRRFDEALDHQLARCARTGERAALAMIDLDGFKALNDTRGHGEGDRVLRAVAAGLSRRLRATDTVGRIGGDEFAVILAGADDLSDIGAWLAAAVTVGSAGTGVTASVGVTELRKGDTAASALERADAAMYEIKRGRASRAAVALGD